MLYFSLSIGSHSLLSFLLLTLGLLTWLAYLAPPLPRFLNSFLLHHAVWQVDRKDLIRTIDLRAEHPPEALPPTKK